MRSVKLGVCPLQLFHLEQAQGDSSKSTAVYKISSKSDDFSLRYGDISILKNGGFGGRWTPKCVYSLSRPPKGTSLRKLSYQL